MSRWPGRPELDRPKGTAATSVRDGRLRARGRQPAAEAAGGGRGPPAVRHGRHGEPRADLGPCLARSGARCSWRPSAIGGIDVRLAFYRGFDEFKVSRWTSDGRELARLMSAVRCLAGRTQIGRLLRYAAEQRRESRIDAVVFVGDCCEEDVDAGRPRGGPARACSACRCSSSRRASDRVASRRVSADRQADARRLLQVRPFRAPTSSSGCWARSRPTPPAARSALLKYGQEQGGAAALLTNQMK